LAKVSVSVRYVREKPLGGLLFQSVDESRYSLVTSDLGDLWTVDPPSGRSDPVALVRV